MLVEKSIQIIGGKKLTGTIEVSGAKNAVLKQMILPILSEGVYKIENVPNLQMCITCKKCWKFLE